MHQYYVNSSPQANGDYQVHKENCVVLPSSRDYVGYFQTCDEAINEAKKIIPSQMDVKNVLANVIKIRNAFFMNPNTFRGIFQVCDIQ